MDLLIQLGGVYNIALVIFHLMFWHLFDWKNDLRKLSFLNRAIMQVLNLSLSFAFIIFGYISLAHTSELLSTDLGHSLLILMTLFWMARAIEQIVFFKLKQWGSVAFLVFFLSGAVLYAIPAIFHP
ncbi:MAG: hypothetical protein HN995_06405 [Candidatus Marinimicrobia bacterium]|jgi:hypothetical protein|nr:hypothetical protein [Candidatus Neomarinimicrobiota bacterium]MBT3575907.1 hypothetical protein [Candidatus Neomarinimicrobiota bacterium]MBT3679396.1 hypothetical protein [Candidatus Neomarinimicrobiota bacterium]MBT3951135.1 hypothetical protein [Candidatus Neomarinimicrobiota bacterium]MBT4254185.1 hypothetical protein [Candidatus Neomarinimicrobiota bacterium]